MGEEGGGGKGGNCKNDIGDCASPDRATNSENWFVQ